MTTETTTSAPKVGSSVIVRLGVISLGDLYADACAVCGCHGYYGLASVYGPEGCVEAVRNGRVYCELHLPRDSQPNDSAHSQKGRERGPDNTQN